MARIKWIRKRDSRQVPFDPTKIADAIYQASRAIGGEDRALADELAEAVTLYLERNYQDSIPGIEEIQDMVEKVLIETGLARTAKAYILYRDQRSRIRETLRVRREIETGSYGVSSDLQVARGGGERVEGWSKGKIAAALVREARLDATLAADVARAVEKKVFASGVKSISTHLIRELVDNELFERGLERNLRRQEQIGIPKYDLEGILLEGGKETATLSARIGNRILREFALEEAYCREVVQAHREGAIHLHGLDSPLTLLEAHLGPIEETRGPGLPAKERLREQLIAADGMVSRSIRIAGYGLEGLGPEIFTPPSALASLRGEWVHNPDGGIHLHLPVHCLPEDDPDRLAKMLSSPGEEEGEVGLVLEMGEEGPLTETILAMVSERVSQGCRVSLRWDPKPEEGFHLAQEVTLNLPRAARAAGAGNFTSFLEGVHSLVSLGRKALLEGRQFRDRVRGGTGAIATLTGAPEVHRLSVVGLADAIRGVTGGDPALGGKSWELHLQALENLRSAVEDLSDLGGIEVKLGESTPQSGTVRFARIDLSTRQGYSQPSPSPAYANGFHLGLEVPIPLEERIAREKEIARRAGFGTFIVPRFTDGPPSPEEVLDLLGQTKGYPGVVTVARVFHPIPED